MAMRSLSRGLATKAKSQSVLRTEVSEEMTIKPQSRLKALAMVALTTVAVTACSATTTPVPTSVTPAGTPAPGATAAPVTSAHSR